MKVIAENLTIKTKYAGLLKEVGEPVAYYYKDHNGHWCFMVKPYCNNEPLFTSDQLVAAILKATKPLEEEVERLKTVPMKYRRMAFNAQLQDENKELRAQLAAVQEEVERLKVDRAKKQKESVTIFDANCELRAQLAAAQEECEFQRNAHKQAEELMLEQSKQLAAAQEENGRLRIALDCTKTDLVRMRCPDFFEGVKGGYETLFDGHLVNMIGLINDYAKQK